MKRKTVVALLAASMILSMAMPAAASDSTEETTEVTTEATTEAATEAAAEADASQPITKAEDLDPTGDSPGTAGELDQDCHGGRLYWLCEKQKAGFCDGDDDFQ